MLDPWTLLSLLATVALFICSTNQSAPMAAALFTLLTTLSSVVLGGRVTKLWVDVSEGGALRARGQAAVRGLKLLLTGVVSLDRKAERLLRDSKAAAPDVSVLLYAVEEVRERCNILAEETTSAIENWTDIVPEADIKSQVGVISELKLKLEQMEADLRGLSGQLSEAKDKSKTESDVLNARFKAKESEVEALKAELRRLQVDLGSRFFGIDPSQPLTPAGATLATLSGSLSAARPYSIQGLTNPHLAPLKGEPKDDKK